MNLIILYIMSISVSTDLAIRSSAFKNHKSIPSQYTCDGLNINPDLEIDDIPANTKSFAVIVDDPDAPNGTFCHWLMWDIPPRNTINEDSAPGIQGRNSFGENNYSGPCPPSGTHHYHFKVFALNTKLSYLPPSTNEQELMDAMQEHIISSGDLVGVYKR